MRITTKGIVLHTVPFSENALIAHIYTQLSGMQSYLVNKVRSGKAVHKRSFFQPLTLVELEAYHKINRDLHKIIKVQPELSFQYGSYSPAKTAIAFFLSEILYKTLRESESHEDLFNFLTVRIKLLHSFPDPTPANFHLFFLIELSRFLGFSPQPSTNHTFLFFDLKEGLFVEKTPAHSHYISGVFAERFNQMLLVENSNAISINRTERKEILGNLVKYYSLHVPGLNQIKSLDVLEAIFE